MREDIHFPFSSLIAMYSFNAAAITFTKFRSGLLFMVALLNFFGVSSVAAAAATVVAAAAVSKIKSQISDRKVNPGFT